MSKHLSELVELLLRFREARDWKQFHTPKNLAISISIEAAELLEHFQWSREDAIPLENRSEIAKEMADIFIYLLLMSNDLGIDLIESAKQKIQENGKKYPVELAKDNATKYNRR